MATRYDVSEVRPLGARAAGQCPVKVQWDVVRPCEPESGVAPDVQQRFDEGNRFEAEIVAELRRHADASWRFLGDAGRRGDPAAIEAATLDAMRVGAAVIVGGRLPVDQVGRRVGEPDLLVRAGDTSADRPGYVPVDVKHHRTLDTVDDGSGTAEVSSAASPRPAAAVVRTDAELRRHLGDALQLAHYRRMLEACGHAAPSGMAGIIGKEAVVVWYHLDAPEWRTPARSNPPRTTRERTAMEVYDFEFDFRLDIAAAARGVVDAADGSELLVEPMRSWDCDTCVWWAHCGPILHSGSGDVSLLPGSRYSSWRAYRDLGIRTRGQLAGVSHRTATVVAAGVDLDQLVGQATAAAADEAAATLPAAGSVARREALAAAGVATVADVLGLGVAPGVGGFPPSAPVDIVNARAYVGDRSVYRWPGAVPIAVPGGDIEIDIDMENDVARRVYLWGALVSDRVGSGLVEGGYRPFASWDPLGGDSERALFLEFWSWLSDVRSGASASGLTVRVYCWHEGAEKGEMLRIAGGDPVLTAAILELTDGDAWVDLLKVFRAQWTTGGSVGLKAIAPLAGFGWQAGDAGGGMSMAYRARAGDPDADADDRREAIAWLLSYNRDDVEATRRIREWLGEPGQAQAPEVEMW